MTKTDTDRSAEQVLRGLVIPARPAVILDLQNEVAKDEPDFRQLARIVGSDVTLSIAVLSLVNSAHFGLNRRIDNIEQAVGVLGLQQLTHLTMAVAMRNASSFKNMKLERFWDASDKRAKLMVRLCRGVRSVNPNLAQAMGLFCDVGIPLLMQRFPEYIETLRLANQESTHSFTELEFERHGMDHARIGAMMARAWGLNDTLVKAIQHHHNEGAFSDPEIREPIPQLIAMVLLCDHSIHVYSRMNHNQEWAKFSDSVAGALMFSDADIEDWIANLTDQLAGH
ncbi:MAG: HDOD domain-containing protein [Curvibacter sp.]|nr:MAG: HDOD domain-containing protein [Curvibacter sp.]